ncbi:SDR family oxidoreductase [Rhodococcus sp. USK13]|uniref:SDR family NAD(P)-dependent oxidoreductase n=1 Tax=Rhodococcus sp. USK13 TaxID=2806442 RepID=UPI001BD0C883|nr:SDR family oxidoreductase [Rhodococcus sp. USK13]
MPMLENKIVIITGAARGMGLETGRACIEAGATVILTDRLEGDVMEAADALGDAAYGHALDVAVPDQWDALTEWLVSTGRRPDALVNNAGLLLMDPIDKIAVSSFDRMMQVNVYGPLLGIQSFLRARDAMPGPETGSVVNISSIRGLKAGANFAGYASSKFAVRGLTKVAAVELGARGIRVNTVCPGPIETPMSVVNPDFAGMDWDAYVARLPMGHMGKPRDIGQAVKWLISDESGFVTGIDLPVDGGLNATTYNVERVSDAD